MLFLNDGLMITNISAAPEGIAKNGSVSDDTPGEEHYWGQACQYLDRGVHVEAGHKGLFQNFLCLNAHITSTLYH